MGWERHKPRFPGLSRWDAPGDVGEQPLSRDEREAERRTESRPPASEREHCGGAWAQGRLEGRGLGVARSPGRGLALAAQLFCRGPFAPRAAQLVRA